MSAFVPIHLQL